MRKFFVGIFVFQLFYINVVAENSYGKFGFGVSSNILPNFVNLIFASDGISKATEAEMKQAEEELALSLRHARDFIRNRYSKDHPYKASIKREYERVNKLKRDIDMASLWKDMSDDEKYEYAKKEILKRNESFKYMKESEYDGNIYIEIKKLNSDYSERTTAANKYAVKRLTKELEELAGYSARQLDAVMRLIELSPETVSYFYGKYIETLTRRYYLRKPALSLETEEYMNALDTCGVIKDQSFAVSLKKKRVNSIALRLAKERDFSEWADSQNVVNLFNSIFLNGYAYYNDYGGAKETKYASVSLKRHLGDVVGILYGPSKNSYAALVNTTAVLQAQAVKKVVSELFKMHGISGDMRRLEYLANPSENAIYAARRSKLESESELKNRYGNAKIYSEYKPWCLYLELLTISLECDKILKAALINNIKNEETADALYNSKIKELLGNTVTASGAYYYNF